ncbi:hypothetical protein BD414DRAFT_538772 [Trametes punicea]|nr:hypothetical protein BD414DRAFT_538772 [Trametes punicea]
MLAVCAGLPCEISPPKNALVIARQTPSVTPVATSTTPISATTADASSQPQPAVSATPQGSQPSQSRQSRRVDATTTAPPATASGGGQDTNPSGQSGQSGQGDASSNQDTASQESGKSSQQQSSQDQSSGPSSPPISSPTSDPPTSPPTSQPTTLPSSQPPTSPPSSDPTSGPSSQPSSNPPTSQPTTLPITTSSSDPSSSPSSQPSSSTSQSPAGTPSDSSQSSTSSDPGSTASSTGAQSTLISAIATTVINGQTSTIFSAIPTTLSQSGGGDNLTSTKRGIIAGSVGGAAILILVISVFLFYRRHQHKKLSFFKRLQPKPRARLLDGEDDDFDLGPPMARYSDYPASIASSHSHSLSHAGSPATPKRSPNAPSFDASRSLLGTPLDPNRTPTPRGSVRGLPLGATVPHLMPMRAESGSIFREGVWPPPGEHSVLVDPIVSAASAVDLGRIIDDVMGPAGSSGGAAAPGAGSASGPRPPSAYRGPGGANASSASVVPDDPFSSLASHNAPRGGQTPSAPPSAMHSRSTSETPLLPQPSPFTRGLLDRDRETEPGAPGSPVAMPRMGPLFVTNMGPLSPPGSPRLQPALPSHTAQQASAPLVQTGSSQGSGAQRRHWLQRSPKKGFGPSLARESADADADVEVTELTSAGHGLGEAL